MALIPNWKKIEYISENVVTNVIQSNFIDGLQPNYEKKR